MNNLPPPPRPEFQNGPGRTATPPVGFGPASSPLAQMRPQPTSRAATPGGPPSATSPPPSEPLSGGRSPFAGQPAPGQLSPGPMLSQGVRPGYRPPTGQPPMSGRVTSPLARSAASMMPPSVANGPAGGHAIPARPMAPPAQQQPQYQQPPPPPPPPQQQQQQLYQQQQAYQQQPPYQSQQPQPQPQPQVYQQQQAYPPQPQFQPQPQYPPAHGLPPQGFSQPGPYPGTVPAGEAVSPVRSPPPPMMQGGSVMPAASSRRRIYPEQSMEALSSQQQQQAPQYGHSGLPPLPGSGQPAADPNAGQGAFFVPGAAQPPIISPSAAQGLSPQGYPPLLATQTSAPMAPQMADLSQQFSQMGVGTNTTEYQTILLGGKPQLSMLDEAPPAIKLPPNATCVPSPFAICPANHKRSTLNAIPRTDKLLKKTKLPFGLVITPFKTQEQGEESIPVVSEIVRCRRCRTYVNPFVQFVEGGRRWKCNLCGLSNDVPLIFDYDSTTQTNRNRWVRPDLNYSVVEFIAPLEYMVRPPMPPVYVFIIDVSYASVQLGAPGVIGQTILSALDRIPNADNRTKVAFIAVDSSLHYFQVRPNGAEPQQLVVSDLDDIFLPSPTDLLLNLYECRQGIECLLSRLESMFKNNHSVGNALCPAILAAQKLLGTLGGKVIVMQASPPTIGEGKVEPRTEGKDLGTSRESDLLRPQNMWYKTMAAECSRTQIAFDTVFIGQQPMDIPTVSCLARYTGGSVFYYPSFMATRKPEVERFSQELSNHLSACVALESVLRVRASKGLRMASYYGNFFLRSLDLLALPNGLPNHSYAVDIEIEDTLTSPVVYFQTALLHTTAYGERRIRVATLALPTTDNIHTVFHHADQVAIASLLSRKAVDRALVAKLEDAREALQHKTLEIIGAFKTECTQSSSGATTQLQIPRSLQLLPFLTLSSLKHTSLRGGSNVPTALRMSAINSILTLPAEQGVQPYTVPRLYALHDLPPQAGYPDEQTGIVVLPPRLGLSAESLLPFGAYLLHDGSDTFLWFGRDVSPALCQALLNVQDVRAIPSGVVTFPDLSNGAGADGPVAGFELNFQVNNILRRLNDLCHNLWKPVTYVCKEEGEPVLRMWMSQRLTEDMDTSAPSYQQFLNQIRDKVNRGNF
ncbi:COPII subunit [Coemansia sp. BCRC 34962]|nr:COPII subunit [Coemansia sp. BCRC 34962]